MKTPKTKELEKALIKTYFKPGNHIVLEVNLYNAASLMQIHGKTDATDFDDVYPGIADGMMVDNYLNFTCFELKVTKSDFHSRAKLSFIGNKNYYVMPEELYEAVKAEIPKHVGVLAPDGYGLLRNVKPARTVEMAFDKSYFLLSMLTSAHNSTTLNAIDAVFPQRIEAMISDRITMKFDRKRHRFAKLEDGSIEPLYYKDGSMRHFYKDEDGEWIMDFDRYIGGCLCYMTMKITEFLEEKR